MPHDIRAGKPRECDPAHRRQDIDCIDQPAFLAALQIDLRDQVKRAVLALLPTGECNLQEVAELVELSPRMLQKRLQKQGLRFSQILSQARMDVAKQHLRYSDINLTELTLNLGFEDPAVFSRAFKLWTGSSPRHWRQLSQAK